MAFCEAALDHGVCELPVTNMHDLLMENSEFGTASAHAHATFRCIRLTTVMYTRGGVPLHVDGLT